MGVAKMRRKMIKEKKEKQGGQEDKEGGTATTSTTTTSIPKKFSLVAKKRTSTVTIVMHLCTILCLFMTGFEVGLQQSIIEYHDDSPVTVHETLAPQQEGLRLLDHVSTMATTTLSSLAPTPSTIQKDVVDSSSPPSPYRSKGGEDDEFKKIEDEQTETENLDPLFGVDLDALTAGPGLLMMMGRFAVSVHRMILAIVYYLPIRIWNTVLSLVVQPPVLCLATLAIRQFSNLLGGKLPELNTEEGKTSTQHQDVMTSISNMVTGFLGKAFPTATKLYEAWTHLRSDMYVVMCGLFTGLVWHHYLASTLQLMMPTGDEL
jgi:hypothetical protein